MDATDLGRAILQRRKKLGLSQEAAAHEAGLTVRYFGDVERGRRKISILMGIRVAAALECKLQDLLDMAEKKRD